MIELGWFDRRRVELIDGRILEMPPQKSEHEVAITLAAAVLPAAFGSAGHVRVQMALALGRRSDPEPDVAVVAGRARDYTRQKPAVALLVVEVALSSLAYDRGRKARLCASAGVADYWIVNLVHRTLEVHRRPEPDGQRPFGHRFADVQTLGPTDNACPLAAPQAKVAVADLLP